MNGQEVYINVKYSKIYRSYLQVYINVKYS